MQPLTAMRMEEKGLAIGAFNIQRPRIAKRQVTNLNRDLTAQWFGFVRWCTACAKAAVNAPQSRCCANWGTVGGSVSVLERRWWLRIGRCCGSQSRAPNASRQFHGKWQMATFNIQRSTSKGAKPVIRIWRLESRQNPQAGKPAPGVWLLLDGMTAARDFFIAYV